MLAFSPGIFWLWLIYRRDKYRPEPRALVIRTFLLGAAVALPVSLVESILYPGSLEQLTNGPVNLALVAYVSFIVAGVTEELAKYLIVKRTIFGSPYFDEPMDGLIYASAAALGFASLENVGYLFSFGAVQILVRGPVSTLGHVLFSAIWGYLLGRQKLHLKARGTPAVLGLIASMAGHGLFDFFLMAQRGYEPLAIFLFVAAGILFLKLLSLADKASPYKGRVAVPLVACPTCELRSSYLVNFCAQCGTSLSAATRSDSAHCSICWAHIRPQDHFCTSCGSRLSRKLLKVPNR